MDAHDRSRAWNKYWKPLYASDYGAFVSTMVNRYKVKGVHTFEIWNEPNSLWFWPSGAQGGAVPAHASQRLSGGQGRRPHVHRRP